MKLRRSLQCAAIALGCLVAPQIPGYAQAITIFDAPGSTRTYPLSINPGGQITGFYDGHGFVRDASGTFSTFDVPGAPETYPTSINPAGEITGWYLTSGTAHQGFVRDARGTITSFDLPGVALPTSINDAGAITGYYFSSDAIHGFVRDAPADTIPPGTTPTNSPGPNANGWNNTNVTVTLNATDNPGGSGVKQIQFSLSGAQSGGGVVNANTASVVISGEGTTTLTYSAQDNAGNAEPQKTLIIQIDKTPPGAGAVASPKPNGNSWNNTNVTVTFSGTDAGSGIDFCTGAITLLGEGAGQSASGTCTDKAGNTSAPAAATPPVISGMPAAGCSLWPPNHKLVQVAVVSAADPLSGVAPGSFEVMGTSNEPDADRAPQVASHEAMQGTLLFNWRLVAEQDGFTP